MKYIQKIIVSIVVITTLGAAAYQAHALTPTLSVSATNGNSVAISVYGDGNASVTLYYNQNNSYPYNNYGSDLIGTLGTTNPTGYFSTILDANTYSIPPGSSVYVVVDNQQSSPVSWPYSNGNYNGSYYSPYNQNYPYSYNYPYGSGQVITLSSNNLVVNQGQEQSVTAMSQSPTNFSISSNSNPSVVTATISGSSIIVYGTNPGSSTLLICPTYSNTAYTAYNTYNPDCASLYVTVTGVPGYGSNPITIITPPPSSPSQVYLSQIPYTGIGSNTKVFLFMLGLGVWTAGLSYFLVRRKMLAQK